MKNLSFISIFFISFLALVILFFSFLAVVDPKQTIELLSSNPFQKYHDNFVLNKIELMQEGRSDFQTLIVGSSTSESFYPIDVDNLFQTQSFSASSGGGQTAVRYAFIQQALKSFKQLERVIYVVDFFEFNQRQPTGEIRYNSTLEALVSGFDLKRGTTDFLRYHFSHQLLESALTVLKKHRRQTPTQLHPDGTTTRSMVLSPIKESDQLFDELSEDQKAALLKHIEENTYVYLNQVLAGFHQLDPEVIAAFERLNQQLSERGIEIIYILAPYQYDFKDNLLSSPQLFERYAQWRELFAQFSQQADVTVIDRTTDSLFINPYSAVWRDGIHFNRKSSYELLKGALPTSNLSL